MKKYGRQVENYNDSVWADMRYQVVLKGVIEKFSQSHGLKTWLEVADTDYFVECSPYDAIWGIKIDDIRVIHHS